jgi:hypothetical protein
LNCNAANLAIAIGNHDEAEALLIKANAAAEMSGLWHHSVSVRLTQADLHLARGESQLAWPLVQEAIAKAGSRERLVPDHGQYWRLRHHHAFISGEDPPTVPNYERMALAHSLELRALVDSVAAEATGSNYRPSAILELVEHGLYGVVARLFAVGIKQGLMQNVPGETSGASAVVNAYPNRKWEEIPSAVLV